MVKNLEKTKKEFEESINDIWIIASLAHILKDSLEYNYEMRKLDRLYLASALAAYTDKNTNSRILKKTCSDYKDCSSGFQPNKKISSLYMLRNLIPKIITTILYSLIFTVLLYTAYKVSRRGVRGGAPMELWLETVVF